MVRIWGKGRKVWGVGQGVFLGFGLRQSFFFFTTLDTLDTLGAL
jgi:hypothetical protein